MKRLLFLGHPQFGYLNDTYYYCRYLHHRFEITYIGWDHGWPKQTVEGVNIKYVSRAGPKLVRYTRFLLAVLKEARGDYDLRFATFFPGCSLVRLIAGRSSTWVLDNRTAAVNPTALGRFLRDRLIRLEASAFTNVTSISSGVARRLHLTRSHILPLGANVISSRNKAFSELRLLYVGTLHNRRLEDTIHGVKLYLQSGVDPDSVRYTIVGAGIAGEEQTLSRLIAKLDVADTIKLTGRIPHDRLGEVFEQHNIGVSYVPLTDYFDHQPPTKTFEYLRSGMPVIGTRTSANLELLDSENGVLIEDSPEAFCGGLASLAAKCPDFRSDQIRERSRKYGWQKIIDENLDPYLRSVITAADR